VAFPFDFVALAELIVRHPMASRWVGADWANTSRRRWAAAPAGSADGCGSRYPPFI
jgi:hypothetical protein